MADIVVSGNSSGSVTLRAPDVSGTTILTLPTTSGTLVTTAGGSTVPFALGSAAAPSITFTGDTNTGMFSPGADTIAFSEGGVESMRIDSAGNVGIGTASPAGRFEVVGTADQIRAGNGTTTSFLGGSAGIGYTGTITNHPFTFYVSGSERMRIDSSGNVGIGTAAPLSASNRTVLTLQNNTWGGQLNIAVAGTAHAQFGTDNFGSGLSCRIQSQDGIVFYGSAGAERMRIDASGNVGIGTSNPGSFGQFSVVGNSTGNIYQGSFCNANTGANTTKNSSITLVLADTAGSTKRVAALTGYPDNTNVLTGGLAFQVRRSDSDVTEAMRLTSAGELLLGTTATRTGNSSLSFEPSNSGIFFRQTGSGAFTQVIFWRNTDTTTTTAGTISTTGTATSYNTSSDYRMKENIAPIAKALEKVAQLKPVTYNWKVDGSNGEGFIAHELAAVCPSAVTGEKDAINEDGSINPQGVDASFLVATLTAAIQEQQALITQLQADVAALKGAK
jgi:hypothetical protein